MDIKRINLSLIILIIFVLILSTTVTCMLFSTEEEKSKRISKRISNNYLSLSELFDYINSDLEVRSLLNKRIQVKGFLINHPGGSSADWPLPAKSPVRLWLGDPEPYLPVINLFDKNSNETTFLDAFLPYEEKEVIIDGIVKNCTCWELIPNGGRIFFQYYYIEVIDIFLPTGENRLPNIYIDEISISNAEPVHGGTISFYVAVINSESTYAEDFDITLSLNNSLNASVIGTEHVDSLAPDETKTLQFSWKAKKGEYLSYVSVDGNVNLVDGESQNSLIVAENGEDEDFTIPIILISIIFVLLVLLVFLLIKRKRNKK